MPVVLVGCGGDPTLVGEPGGAGAPAAALSLSVPGGQVPLDVVLDASASTPFSPGDALIFDFDFDGDGAFEVERSPEAIVEHTYALAGDARPLVRVRGPDGRYDVADAALVLLAPNPPRTADVDVDSDHDGAITGADELVEDSRRAAFIANVDDDDGDGQRDRQDVPLDPEDDDMIDVVVRRVTDLGDARVFVEVTPSIAQQRTRLWHGDEVLTDAEVGRAVVDGAGDADVTLRLEALTGRTGDWDGVVVLTVTVEDDDVISSDTVELRAAPVLFPDNLQRPRRLFVMDVPIGEDNNRALLSAFRAAPGLPDGVALSALDADRYFADRWVQDNWEIGTQLLPVAGGVKEMRTAMQLERSYGGQGLDAFVPGEWLGPGRGYFYPGGAPSSHNYGGNLEIAPPTARAPFGRVLFGGGTSTLTGARNPDTMNEDQVSFLNAQELQGPAVELSSEWLAVGHIDEIFQFVPDLTPDDDGESFKVVLASPAMAREALLAAQQSGHGDAVVFAGRRASVTVDEILAAEDFLALNELAQARIDGVQRKMQTTLGLDADDFLPVPVLYEEVDGQGLVAAFNPGIQNLVTMADRLFVPDPEGPRVDGVDLWQEATRTSLAGTDLDVVFVDVFQSYHELLGEAHCGTNVEREPWDTAWWSLAENVTP